MVLVVQVGAAAEGAGEVDAEVDVALAEATGWALADLLRCAAAGTATVVARNPRRAGTTADARIEDAARRREARSMAREGKGRERERAMGKSRRQNEK